MTRHILLVAALIAVGVPVNPTAAQSDAIVQGQVIAVTDLSVSNSMEWTPPAPIAAWMTRTRAKKCRVSVKIAAMTGTAHRQKANKNSQ
jgi:hypothetical protein